MGNEAMRTQNGVESARRENAAASDRSASESRSDQFAHGSRKGDIESAGNARADQHAAAEDMAREHEPKVDRPATNEHSKSETTGRLTEPQQQLVEDHLGLVAMHLRNRVPTPRLPHRQREYDDLYQEGCLALLEAALRYRATRDGAFVPYALLRIRRSIHDALLDQFSVVKVPVRAMKQAMRKDSHVQWAPLPTVSLPDRPLRSPTARDPSAPQGPCLRHLLREQFERAVYRAIKYLHTLEWRHRNPCDVMERLARERLLIAREAERTPLRRIARDHSVSSSRAVAYEKQLLSAVESELSRDPQFALLMRFAGDDAAAWDARLDESQVRQVREAKTKEFEKRFEQLNERAKAVTLYRLLERSTPAIEEVARNLYTLTDSTIEDLMADLAQLDEVA